MPLTPAESLRRPHFQNQGMLRAILNREDCQHLAAPGKITYYLDDVEVGSTTKAAAPGPWPWGPDVMRPNFLILDLAIGGAGQPAPTAPAVMLVDRVEVTTT